MFIFSFWMGSFFCVVGVNFCVVVCGFYLYLVVFYGGLFEIEEY